MNTAKSLGSPYGIALLCVMFCGQVKAQAIIVERLAARDSVGNLIAFSWSPVHDWETEDISRITGNLVGVAPVGWQTRDGEFVIQHLAAMNPNGDLLVFFWSPREEWRVVNVSQKTGQRVASVATAWQTQDGSVNVEHLAAMSPGGDLLVFFWSPLHDWQVVNVSQKTGQRVASAATSWQSPDGQFNVEHLAAMSPSGDLLVFFWSPRRDWQVVNVSQKTGQRVSGPVTSWQAPDGPFNVEHLGGKSPTGDLIVFFWSARQDWQVVNVTEKTGQKVRSAATSWQTRDGPVNVEHLAAVGTNEDLLVFFWTPQRDWQVVNVSQKTGQRVTAAPTSWQTPDGTLNVEHLGAMSPNGDLLVFFWSARQDWQVVNASNIARSQRIAGELTSWQTHDLSPRYGVLTQHNDNFRTGAQLNETALTPASVRLRGMRVKYQALVEGNINAQPLYVRSIPFSDGSANALYVVTDSNNVYALDAESGVRKWSRSLQDSNPGVRPLPHGGQNPPVAPVIDLQSWTIYVVFSTKNQMLDWAQCASTATIDPSRCDVNNNPCACANSIFENRDLAQLDVAYWLVALDMRTGNELRRTLVQSTVTRGDGSSLPFNAAKQINHPALLLDHGSIYIAFGSRAIEGSAEYHGWVMRYDAATLRPQGVFCNNPDVRGATAEGGGIWQGGGGLAADADGNVYFLVGNAPANPAARSYGDSFVKLTPRGDTLVLSGSVAPTNAAQLDDRDLDLGSGGLTIIPGTKFLVGGGKTGTIFLVDGNTMSISQSFQAFTNTYHPDWNFGCPRPVPTGCADWKAGPHLHGSPTFWNNRLYHWSEKDHLKLFRFGTAYNRFDETPLVGDVLATANLMPGGLTSLSANGNTPGSGIVWATLPSNGPSHIYAFDGETLDPLWDGVFPSSFPTSSHHAPPTVADGKLIVATQSGGIVAYELGSPQAVLAEKTFPRWHPLQPTEPPPHPAYMVERSIGSLPSLLRNQLAPPLDQTVLFRLHSQFDGKKENFDGGFRSGADWVASDGSRLIAEEVKEAPAPEEHSPAWQLFRVTRHEGKGNMARVEWIQRIETSEAGATLIFYGKNALGTKDNREK